MEQCGVVEPRHPGDVLTGVVLHHVGPREGLDQRLGARDSGGEEAKREPGAGAAALATTFGDEVVEPR